MLCCEECPATDVHSVLRCVILAASYVKGISLRLNATKMCKFYICALVGITIE